MSRSAGQPSWIIVNFVFHCLDSIISFVTKSQISGFCSCTRWFLSDLNGYRKDRVFLSHGSFDTVMTLSFLTGRSGQTVQTQIRLLLEEQSDQGLHCLLFHFYHFDKIFFKVWPLCWNFR